jgi:uncharacterized protein YceH (UPF0502 family)
MAPFSDVGQVEAALEGLSTREDGPFVVRLPREPGRRDSRYAHLFSGPVAVPPPEAESPADVASGAAEDTGARLDRLEEQLRQLREELDELKKRVPQ